MFLSSFESILRTLEDPMVADAQLKKFVYKFVKNDNVYRPLFEAYVSRRLHENVHPDRLLNIAYHLEKSEETQYLSEILNNRLFHSLSSENKNFDQFYFMCRHDLRKERHILTDLFSRLASMRVDDSIKLIETIAPNIGLNKHELIFQMLEHGIDNNRLLHLILADRLPVEDQFEVMLRAIDKHSNVFFVMLESSSLLRGLIHDNLHKNKDKDRFAISIMNSMLHITKFESSYSFNDIIELHSKDIPEVLARLYVRAEQEERWEYLLKLGANKNKKELLRSIVKSKDHELIDKFFFLYKNYPEVKHLTPFI